MIANDPGDLCSIPGQVIPKTQKMVLDTSLLNTQHYKVQIKGKVGQSWERSCAHPYRILHVTLDFGHRLTTTIKVLDLMQAIIISGQDIGMEFGIEKWAIFIMKKDKKEKLVLEKNCQIRKASEHLEKKKITSTWE